MRAKHVQEFLDSFDKPKTISKLENEQKLYDLLYDVYTNTRSLAEIIDNYSCPNCINSIDGHCKFDNGCTLEDSASFEMWWYNFMYGNAPTCKGCINSGRPTYDYPCSSCNHRDLYDPA